MSYILNKPITPLKILKAFKNPNNKKVLGYVKSNPSSSVSKIVNELGIDKSFTSRILDDFKILGILKCKSIGTSNLYSIHQSEYKKYQSLIDKYQKIELRLAALVPPTLKAS